MDIIVIILIVWYVVAKSNKKKKQSTTQGTVLNGKTVDTGSKKTTYTKDTSYTPQRSSNVNRQKMNPAKQQELKQRLQQKYVNSAQKSVQGNTYQKPEVSENDILSRAKSNVNENTDDMLKQQMLEESAGGVYTAKGTMQTAAELWARTNRENYDGYMDDSQESDILKQVNDLIVMGYSGDLTFERDFVAEGIDMLNSYEM